MPHIRPWTDAQERFMRTNAGKVPVSTMTNRFKRTEAAIRQKAHHLGVSLARENRRRRSYN